MVTESVNCSGAYLLSFAKQAAPRPEYQRVDQEGVLVDETVFHECLDKLAAAEDGDVLPLLLLEGGNGHRSITRHQGGVYPRERIVQGVRCDVLLRLVQNLGERVGICLLGPEGVHALVGPAPEEQVALPHSLPHLTAHDLVAIGRSPPAVLKPAPSVLVGTTRRLHHAIEETSSPPPPAVSAMKLHSFREGRRVTLSAGGSWSVTRLDSCRRPRAYDVHYSAAGTLSRSGAVESAGKRLEP